MTKIVFMGTPDFSVPVLTMLHNEGFEIAAVVTQPDRPVGRKRVLTPPPVKVEANRLGLTVLQPEKLRNSDELTELKNMNPDLIVTAAYGQILPKDLLDVPRLGCINVHASLLPKYRGGAPIHQAVMDGEAETGVTIMYMVEKLDAGDIISQVRIPILEEDNTGILFEKLSTAGTQLLKETLPSIVAGTNDRIPQDEKYVTFAGNITREQERIDWSRGGNEIFNKVRGLYPWPGAYSVFQDGNVKVWKAKKSEIDTDASPGTIIKRLKDSLVVKTGDGTSIAITELQPAGKKRMAAEEFMNGAGANWNEGDHFE
ncbi:methionyl-tRNA formyltransferase [Sporosarcina thermotolerans]|uniref:Methionyl-tRNA formyltransferase n=1 Tax=Sporosarcina thermotolerans TaxID=633404 RepID=A0AAW9A4S3_9BACL|nr:methionyl-tRNA formyltransferase [Sporosarcina thermotolerans]MDW0115784.1 methionyl-tRNA formyltransferase [Sporosarcina thermotolerans]